MKSVFIIEDDINILYGLRDLLLLMTMKLELVTPMIVWRTYWIK